MTDNMNNLRKSKTYLSEKGIQDFDQLEQKHDVSSQGPPSNRLVKKPTHRNSFAIEKDPYLIISGPRDFGDVDEGPRPEYHTEKGNFLHNKEFNKQVEVNKKSGDTSSRKDTTKSTGLLDTKKKKVNKHLREILGPDHKKIMHLCNDEMPKYFVSEEERKQVTSVMAKNFMSKPDDYQKKQFGYTPRQFTASIHNPFRQHNLQNKASACNESHGFAGFCAKKEKHTHGTDLNETNSFWQYVIISEDSKVYLIFNMIVSANCLISSYYYGALVGFRYSLENSQFESNKFYTCLAFESVFFIHMLTQFLLEYRLEGEKVPIRDPFKIWVHYSQKGNFFFDFFVLIPFQFLKLKRNRQELFYLIKMLRIIKGFRLFDVPDMMAYIKQQFHKKTQYIVDNVPDLANDIEQDNTSIQQILAISYTLKTFKLVVIILNISYLCGVFFYVLCEFVEDFLHDQDIEELHQGNFDYENPGFLKYYEINDNTRAHNLLISVYFAFTSLSTVGFGDYAPRGNHERFFGAFMLLFGVAIFSYIMGNFIDILNQFQNYQADLDDGDTLTKFFGVIKKFNGEKSLNIELKNRIEAHFTYRWQNDKLMAFRDEQDLSIFSQLPESVRQMMYTEFLFRDFLDSYKQTFSSFPNDENINQHSYYTWYDFHYRKFMESLLNCLEPRREEKNVIIYDELDEVNEVIFFEEGIVDVGFDLNRQKSYVVRIESDILIGGYHMTFDKRTECIYRSSMTCTGFSIRRTNWKSIVLDDEFKMITQHLKNALKIHYENSMFRVNQEKEKLIKKWQNRKDYEAILRVVPNDPEPQTLRSEHGKSLKHNQTLTGIEEQSEEHEHCEMISEKLKEYQKGAQNIMDNYDELYVRYIKSQSEKQKMQQEIDKLKLQNQILMANQQQKDYSSIRQKGSSQAASEQQEMTFAGGSRNKFRTMAQKNSHNPNPTPQMDDTIIEIEKGYRM